MFNIFLLQICILIKQSICGLKPSNLDGKPTIVNQITHQYVYYSLIYMFFNSRVFQLNPNSGYFGLNMLAAQKTTPSTVTIPANPSKHAIGCWNNVDIMIINENGSVIASINQNNYEPLFKCSIIKINELLYFLAYTTRTDTFLQFYKFDNYTNELTKDSMGTTLSLPLQSILCSLSYDFEVMSCLYYDTSAAMKFYYSNNLALAVPDTVQIGNIEGRPEVYTQTKGPYTIVLAISNEIAYGYVYKYILEQTTAVPPIIARVETVVPRKDLLFTSGPIKSISCYNVTKQYMGNVISVLLTIACSDTLCQCKYFSFSLTEALHPFTVDLEPGETNLDVSIIINSDVISIIIAQSSYNYVVAYAYPRCTEIDDLFFHYTADPFILSEVASNKLKTMTISFLSVTGNNIFLKNSMEIVLANTYYDVNKIYFTFTVAGEYSFRYWLKDIYGQEVTVCKLSILVCSPDSYCKTCSGYGNLINPKCLTCQPNYYTYFKARFICITKESCISQKGSILNVNGEGQCVNSCVDHGLGMNYLLDVDNSECVTECKSTQLKDLIGYECLNERSYNEKMDYYIANLKQFILGLYSYYPLRFKEEYIMSIYNTSSLPDNNTLQAISLGGPYDIVFVSSVHLGKCEQYLKESNQLDPSEPLIIAKFDKKNPNQISHQVEFLVFSSDGLLLDHTKCDRSNEISIISPINTESNEYLFARSYAMQNIDVFKATEPFFNDICYPFTTEYLTDIPLIDRLEDVFMDEAILCNNGCEYKSIDYTKNTVLCSCSKEAVHLYKTNYDNLFASLTDLWTQSNFAVIKCANLVFDSKKFCQNLGSWFMLFLIFIEITSALYFFLTEFKVIENHLLAQDKNQKQLDVIDLYIAHKASKAESSKPEFASTMKQFEELPDLYGKDKAAMPIPMRNNIKISSTHNLSFDEEKKHTDQLKHNSIKAAQKAKFDMYDLMENNNLKNSEINLNQESHQMIDNKLFEDKTPNRVLTDKRKTFIFNISNHSKLILLPNNEADKSNDQSAIPNNNNNNNKTNQVQGLTREKRSRYRTHKPNPKQTITDLSEKIDVQIEFNFPNFIFFYLSFLRTLQPILRSFFIKTYQRTRVIQISMFFFCTAVSFTLNALFFSDKYVSKSYETKGGINFFFNMPKMIYSFILSYALKILFNILSSIGSVITVLAKKGEMSEKRLVIKRLKMRLLIFYILKIVFIVFFWYYVAAFCAVYPNIQTTWIISSLTTFILEMIFPFGIAAALTIVLIISHKYKLRWLTSFTKKFTVS